MALEVPLPTARTLVAVVCAVGAAASYGLSNVLQQHEAEQIGEGDTLHYSFLGKLARRPRWLAGMGADVGGYVFEALALGIGTLVLVEPILAMSLLLSLFFGALITGREITRSAWRAAVVFAVGVSLFLYLGSPSQGIDLAPTRDWIVAAPVLGVVILACIVAGRTSAGPRRAVFLGMGAGTLFGVSALLTRAFVHYLGGGILNWVPHWEPYVLAVCSISGLVLAQSAFQTGALAAAVSAEQVLQPLTGVVLGIGMLDEHLTVAGFFPTLLLLVAFTAMIWGVMALARAEHGEELPPPVLVDGR